MCRTLFRLRLVAQVADIPLLVLQESKRYCREIVKVLKSLKENRDMSLAEVKLTIAIEDPSRREQKEYMGIEVRYRNTHMCMHHINPG